MFDIIKCKKAFTLIEIMSVMAIIAIISYFSIVTIIRFQNQSELDQYTTLTESNMNKVLSLSMSNNLPYNNNESIASPFAYTIDYTNNNLSYKYCSLDAAGNINLTNCQNVPGILENYNTNITINTQNYPFSCTKSTFYSNTFIIRNVVNGKEFNKKCCIDIFMTNIDSTRTILIDTKQKIIRKLSNDEIDENCRTNSTFDPTP